MSAREGAKSLKCDEEEEEFHERLFIIDRMGKDEGYAKKVVEEYRKLK